MMRGMLVAIAIDAQGDVQIWLPEHPETASVAMSKGQMRTKESSGVYCAPALGIFMANS